MKKNNKGFTLIELIAAIVVLGLLVAISVPLVTKNINFGRSKTYVQDANKLIALAEYKLNSNSSNIQKPDPGNCIVLGFDYINDGSISNPPNKGTYNGDVSFVVVKNDTGKLEYAVFLVEEEKNSKGYSGVKLSTYEQINNNSSSSRVAGFDKNDLICLNSEACKNNDISEDRVISKKLINDNITSKNGSYIDKLEKVYIMDELEQGDPSNAFAPSIKKSYVDFDNNISEINKVGFIVYINAVDKDNTGADELSVCISDSSTNDSSYPSKDSDLCEKYTSGSDYFKKFSYIVTPEDEAAGVTKYFYISVYDNNGNVSNTKFEKEISKNKAPEIKISASKRDEDKLALHIARIRLSSVQDDRSNKENLLYCVNQSSDSNTCSDYMSYNDSFGLGYYDYIISDSSGQKLTKPDGNEYNIYVHAKDSYGAVGSAVTSYKISDLTAPDVKYSVRNDVIYGKNDLSGYLDVTVNDNYPLEDVRIKVIDDVTREYSYNEYINDENKRRFEFAKNYDGKDRELRLEVINKYGESVSNRITIDDTYKNQPPKINNFSISGPGYVALEGDFSENKPTVIFSVSDDFDSKLYYCISESGTCKDDDYKEISANETIKINHTFSYNKSDSESGNRSLTLFVKDSLGKQTIKNVVYNKYKNVLPSFKGEYSIISADSLDTGKNNDNNEEDNKPFKNLNSIIVDTSELSVIDDTSDYKVKFCYTVGNDNTEICSSDYVDYNKLVYSLSRGIVLVDSNSKSLSHDGQEITTFFMVKDRFGETNKSKEVKYTLYKDNKPTIQNNKIVNEKVLDEDSNSNSYSIVSYYKIYDKDEGDTYSVCVTDNSNKDNECTSVNSTNYKGPYTASNSDTEFEISYRNDGESIYSVILDDGKEYTDSEDSYVRLNVYDVTEDSKGKSLYLYIKDDYGNIEKYTLYSSCSSIDYSVETTYSPVGTGDNDKINSKVCKGICTLAQSKKENTFKLYKVQEKFSDLMGKFCSNDLEKNLGCDHYTCIATGLNDSKNNVIGTVHVITADYSEGVGDSVICHGFYTMYKSTIDTSIGVARLQRFAGSDGKEMDAYKICDSLIDNYKYNENDPNNSYLRVDDSSLFDNTYNCDEDANGVYTCKKKNDDGGTNG